MTEEYKTTCPDPEACVTKSEPCDNFEHCVKLAEPSLEEVVRELRKDFHRLSEECSRLGKERDLLADMYARERFENHNLRDVQRYSENAYQDICDAVYELRRILFNEGKVRMSKETRAEISKYLSF